MAYYAAFCSPSSSFEDESSLTSADSYTQPLGSHEECCGWLWVRGKILRRWKYRYFTLRGAILTYYSKFPTEEYFKNVSPSDQSYMHLEGTIPRGVLRVAHVEECYGNALGFKVYGTSGKVVDIRAAKSSIRDVWISALVPAAKGRSRAWSGEYAYSDDGLYSEEHSRMSIPVIKNGWMLKQSRILKQWRRYFFVLQGDMISYYTNNKPWIVPRHRGYVRWVERPPGMSNGLLIGLSTGGTLHLQTEDDGERDVWLDALQSSVSTWSSIQNSR